MTMPGARNVPSTVGAAPWKLNVKGGACDGYPGRNRPPSAQGTTKVCVSVPVLPPLSVTVRVHVTVTDRGKFLVIRGRRQPRCRDLAVQIRGSGRGAT